MKSEWDIQLLTEDSLGNKSYCLVSPRGVITYVDRVATSTYMRGPLGQYIWQSTSVEWQCSRHVWRGQPCTHAWLIMSRDVERLLANPKAPDGEPDDRDSEVRVLHGTSG